MMNMEDIGLVMMCVFSGGDEAGEIAPGRSQDEEGGGHGVRLRQ